MKQEITKVPHIPTNFLEGRGNLIPHFCCFTIVSHISKYYFGNQYFITTCTHVYCSSDDVIITGIDH